MRAAERAFWTLVVAVFGAGAIGLGFVAERAQRRLERLEGKP